MVGLTQQNIIHFIDHPKEVNNNQIKLLCDLSDKHPYSSFIHTLLAKIFHAQKHIGYNNQLEKAAFTITDRYVLYNYIQREALLHKIDAIIKDTDAQKVISKPLSDLKQKDVESDPELLELEKNILTAAINMSIQQEADPALSTESTTKKSNIQSNINKVKENLDTKKMPLSSWLFSSDNTFSKKEISNQDVSSMIDSFIKEDSNKLKQPFFSPSESAKMSLIDDDEFVTETLAEIHVRQGNYPKAIKIYEKLMLNFPEKKTFFASRIRFIKEKSNYT